MTTMTDSKTNTEKGLASIDTKLPAGWQCTTDRTTGYGKRVAVFEHQDTSQRVTIQPWKTHRQPGFADAHRVLSLHDDEREVLAVGHDIERIPDAERVALTAMRTGTRR
jgi:hypothetical protein